MLLITNCLPSSTTLTLVSRPTKDLHDHWLYLCAAELTTRLPFSATKPSNYNNLHSPRADTCLFA